MTWNISHVVDWGNVEPFLERMECKCDRNVTISVLLEDNKQGEDFLQRIIFTFVLQDISVQLRHNYTTQQSGYFCSCPTYILFLWSVHKDGVQKEVLTWLEMAKKSAAAEFNEISFPESKGSNIPQVFRDSHIPLQSCTPMYIVQTILG